MSAAEERPPDGLPVPDHSATSLAAPEQILVVEASRDAVHSADEGVDAAADHAEPDARRAPLGLAFDRHFESPSMRRFAAWSVPASAKSSNARSVTRMMCSRTNFAPSSQTHFGVGVFAAGSRQ